MTDSDWKIITYRGGVLRFRIPADWEEQYERDGGGMFYEPGNDTGTLRLNVTTASIKPGTPLFPVNAHRVLQDFADQYETSVQTLRPNLAMIRFDRSTVEQGQQITLRTWQIAQVLGDSDLRILLFTYTLLTEVFSNANSQEEMSHLEREILNAELSPTIDVLTSDSASEAKPWWRFW